MVFENVDLGCLYIILIIIGSCMAMSCLLRCILFCCCGLLVETKVVQYSDSV
jgi:hypothetical protein